MPDARSAAGPASPAETEMQDVVSVCQPGEYPADERR
jgi:hypothetical protein